MGLFKQTRLHETVGHVEGTLRATALTSKTRHSQALRSTQDEDQGKPSLWSKGFPSLVTAGNGAVVQNITVNVNIQKLVFFSCTKRRFTLMYVYVHFSFPLSASFPRPFLSFQFPLGCCYLSMKKNGQEKMCDFLKFCAQLCTGNYFPLLLSSS